MVSAHSGGETGLLTQGKGKEGNIGKPILLNRNNQTLIDLISANKPDLVTKTYILVSSLSHRRILLEGKLTNQCLAGYFNNREMS